MSRVVHNFKVMNDLNRGDHFEKKEVGGIDVHNMTLHLKNVLFLNATKRNRPTIYFLLPYILHFTLIIGIHASRASPPMSSAEIDNENIVGCKNYVRIIHFK